MYGGTRMNAASSAPVQMPDVSSKPVQRALQNAQEFVSDVAHQYQRMKDFGEQTRLEGRMNDLASEFEQEMTRRLGFARGHELSFYDRDGRLKESALNTFVRNYEGKFRELKGSFVSQEEAARFGARQQDVMRRLQGRASELVLKGQIQESRQAFEEGLKGDLLRRDYQGATRRRIQAYEAGIISENGMNNGILEDTRNGLLDEYEQDMLINPSVAFTKLGDGYFDALGAGDVLKLKEKTRRFLRSANRSESEDGAPGYAQTMIYIILPQAFKNVLPSLGNEFIVLLKETSVSGYIALQDLTKGGDIIRSQTYTAFMPLTAVALIYLSVVMLFSWMLGKLERKLKNNE